MPRRVSLPGASELFRSTGPVDPAEPNGAGEADAPRGPSGASGSAEAHRQELRLAEPPVVPHAATLSPGPEAPEPAEAPQPEPAPAGRMTRRTAAERGSGRVRHEEKITVYVSSDELIALEEARLRLRAEHGLAVDRGRIVRQAISAAMADFAAQGAGSELVRKLSAS